MTTSRTLEARARSDPWLLAAALPFLLLLCSRADFIPIWDGRIYAECIVGAARAHLAPASLQCADHLSYAYTAMMGLAELLAPGSYLPMLAADAAMGVASMWALEGVLARLFPGPERRVERLVLVAALGVNPVFVASFLNVNPDTAVVTFFLLATRALLDGRLVRFTVFGLVLCFCKEVGPILFGWLLAIHGWLEILPRGLPFRERLGRLRRAAPLTLPLVAFAAALAARSAFASHALWAGVTPAGAAQRLVSFELDSVLAAYGAGIFVLNFHWAASLVASAYLLRVLATRLVVRQPLPEAAGERGRAVTFVFFYFLGTAFLLTRFRTFPNARYWLPVYPTMLAFLLLSLEWALRSRRLRRAFLGALTLAFTLSNFATLDPISRAAYGTFQLGSRPMLRMTSIAGECCGAGRDQLVYDLEYTEFHYLQEAFYRDVRPTAETVLAVSPWADWHLLGGLDPQTFGRTLDATRAVTPRLVEPARLSAMPEPPREVYYLAFANVDNAVALQQLTALYPRAEGARYTHGGYALDVVRFTRP